MMSVQYILLFWLIQCITPVFAQDTIVGYDAAVRYILSCRKPNGGFGPTHTEYTDLAWTYPAVASLKILGVEIPDPDSCYVNGGKSWIEKASWKNGPWYWSLHQKANLHRIMDQTGPMESDFPLGEIWDLQYMPRRNYTEFREYTQGKFFDMASLWYLTEAIYMSEGSVENRESIKAYVLRRRTGKGGFEDMLGPRNTPENERSHVVVTHCAIQILKTLGIAIPGKEDVIAWIRSCQTPEGGFRWHPEHASYSNQPDVWYTWTAIKALKTLGSEPADVEACLRWLNSLQNVDGGFADRPGWNSRLYSTYYAVHSIAMLTGDVEAGIEKKIMAGETSRKIPEGMYSIFQAHHKSPPGGNEMVDTALAIGLNLIAVKTTEQEVGIGKGMSEVVAHARQYAAEKDYPIEIVDSPENYLHRLQWFSGMPGNHASNFMIPPDLSGEERDIYLSAYSAGLEGSEWSIFRNWVIQPLLNLGTLFYPELDYTRLNAYMVYDEGLDGHTGYNAVPAAHFGNYDWVRHFPYKERWLGQLPMIADGDAHAGMKEWRPNLDAYRNVYIAKSYRYADYLDASMNGRSVCVIRMPGTGKIRYYGSTEAIDYLEERIAEWKWW